MEYTAFIDFNSFPEEAKKEMESFYEYLIFKYRKNKKKKDFDKSKKEEFFGFVESHSYKLPDNYRFNRNELHER